MGNAVMAGDPCAWHVDADPTTVPPYSPWVHNYGYYHNRWERGAGSWLGRLGRSGIGTSRGGIRCARWCDPLNGSKNNRGGEHCGCVAVW